MINKIISVAYCKNTDFLELCFPFFNPLKEEDEVAMVKKKKNFTVRCYYLFRGSKELVNPFNLPPRWFLTKTHQHNVCLEKLLYLRPIKTLNSDDSQNCSTK